MSKQNKAVVKAAAVQAAPVFMNLAEGVEKAKKLIKEAADQGCDLIGFPETWLPGYPWFIWLNSTAGNMKYIADYHKNCLVVGSDEFNEIAQAAKENNIYVSMGASERDHGSLYIAQFLFGRDGELIHGRRKLKATHMERTLFGDGYGEDLQVNETDIGRVGQLACWEHMQPLSKYALYSQHEEIHVAAWPSFSIYPNAFALGAQVNNSASQIYAVEGGCFVVAPCGVISPEMIEVLAESEEHHQLIAAGGGYGMIYGPDGSELCERLAPGEEGLLIADLPKDAITISKCFTDPVGHYARPDATKLLINRQPQLPMEDFTPEMTSLKKVEQSVAKDQEKVELNA